MGAYHGGGACHGGGGLSWGGGYHVSVLLSNHSNMVP